MAAPRSIGSLVLLVSTALVVVGCGDSGDEENAEGDAPSSTMSVPEGIELGDQPSTTAPPTTAPPPDVPEEVVLSPEGVGDLSIGSAPRVDVMATLVPLLGEPVVEAAECPGGSDTSMRWEGGPTLYFASGQLSGWSYGGDEDPVVPIQTDAGIAPGATVAELLAAYPADFQWVPDSTLGDEFYIGTGFPYVGGVATGRADDDTVDVIWAGDSCVFR